MVAVLSWALNLALFVLGCLLAADTANAILAATLLSSPDETGEVAAPPPVAARSWEERESILSRNLFKSSTVESAVSVEPVEDIEPTRLPLTLLGTAAAENPRLAWAAIEDRDKRETVVVGIGDRVAGKAAVQRIERRRVILLENGSPRELTLDEDDEERAKPRTTARARPSRSRASRREARQRASERRAIERRAVVAEREPNEALRDPANIFSQARILPKWEDGEMLGVELAAIKNGSLLQDAGFQNGDVIVEMNGIPVDSPEQSAKLMKEFSSARSISATVNRRGQDVTLQFEVDE
jgi:general secretion pathway protein C